MTDTTALTRYTTDGGVEVALSPKTVRDYLVSGGGKVTDQEVIMFLELCRAQRINPFLREAYLIKYGDQAASIVTGKDTFLKRAEQHSQFDGFEAGITVATKDGDIVRREGALYGVQTERLIGGWARVYRKDRSHPFYAEVSYSEYEGRKNDGKPNRQWQRMPATMIRKVPLVQALREAFPESFGGMYSPEEIREVDGDTLPAEPVTVSPDEETADFEILADEKTLAEIRALKDELGIDDEMYLRHLEIKQGAPVACDTELTTEGARQLLGQYKLRKRGLEEAEAERRADEEDAERLQRVKDEAGLKEIVY